MNIGILTYHWVSNFGANLQALSTYCYFKNIGHNPIIINWIPEDLENHYKKCVSKEQNEVHHNFAKSHFTCITKKCRSSEDVAAEIVNNNIELVVIGSDAVFTYIPKLKRIHLTKRGFIYSKPCIDSDFPNPYWADFCNYLVKPIKICAMSASAQNTYYKYIFNKKSFATAISKFSFMSVRDIWTQKMIAYLTKGEVIPIITPDPVFAFEQNVQPNIVKDSILVKFNLPEKYAIVSITDKHFSPEWVIRLEQKFRLQGITLITLDQTNKTLVHKLLHHVSFPLDPLDWYSLIKYSQGYIGELMHPILVALHNSVPVYPLDLYGFKKDGKLDITSSKTYQIISRFELLDNYFNHKLYDALPNPLDVVDRIVAFDRRKCENKALVMLNDYNLMMKKIAE